MSARKVVMTVRLRRALLLCPAVPAMLLVASLHGASAVSRQQADVFAKKIETIERHAAKTPRPSQRTPVTESEINSWFAYRSDPVLPDGLTRPSLTILGNGRVTG